MKNACTTLFKLGGGRGGCVCGCNLFKKYYVEIRNKYPQKITIFLNICSD